MKIKATLVLCALGGLMASVAAMTLLSKEWLLGGLALGFAALLIVELARQAHHFKKYSEHLQLLGQDLSGLYAEYASLEAYSDRMGRRLTSLMDAVYRLEDGHPYLKELANRARSDT